MHNTLFQVHDPQLVVFTDFYLFWLEATVHGAPHFRLISAKQADKVTNRALDFGSISLENETFFKDFHILQEVAQP